MTLNNFDKNLLYFWYKVRLDLDSIGEDLVDNFPNFYVCM